MFLKNIKIKKTRQRDHRSSPQQHRPVTNVASSPRCNVRPTSTPRLARTVFGKSHLQPGVSEQPVSHATIFDPARTAFSTSHFFLFG